MNKNLKNIGIASLVAGALFYPALKLYQYLAKKRAEGAADEKEPKKTMRLMHQTKHTPHHQAAHNGHAKHDVV